MKKRMEIVPYEMTLHVMEDSPSGHGFCAGELHITIDGSDTAWVEPCSRLEMTEPVVEHLANFLRPFGVAWMRGWHDGHFVGRVISEDGNLGVAKDPRDSNFFLDKQ